MQAYLDYLYFLLGHIVLWGSSVLSEGLLNPLIENPQTLVLGSVSSREMSLLPL